MKGEAMEGVAGAGPLQRRYDEKLLPALEGAWREAHMQNFSDGARRYWEMLNALACYGLSGCGWNMRADAFELARVARGLPRLTPEHRRAYEDFLNLMGIRRVARALAGSPGVREGRS